MQENYLSTGAGFPTVLTTFVLQLYMFAMSSLTWHTLGVNLIAVGASVWPNQPPPDIPFERSTLFTAASWYFMKRLVGCCSFCGWQLDSCKKYVFFLSARIRIQSGERDLDC